MKKDNKKTFKYLFILWMMILCIGLVKRSLQNDTFYTIKIGKLILDNGIDMLDHFSFHQGLAYTYPHWLYDVFIYLIFHLFNYRGIYISSIVLFMILLLIVFKINIKNTNNYIVSAFCTFLCSLAIGGFVTARAQLVSFILFALEIYFIESLLKSGNKKNLIGLLIISLLICNTHVAVWPFYFIIILTYIVEYIITIICKKIKFKKENKFIKFIQTRIVLEDNKNIKYLFIVILLSLLTGLMTPIGTTPYTYFLKTAAGNSQSYIQEHQMLTWIDSPFTIIITFEALFFALLSKIKLRDLFLILGTSLMSVLSIRHIALLALIGTICFARTFDTFLICFDFHPNDKLYKFLNKKIVIIISFIVVTAFTTFIVNYRQLKEPYVDKKLYPVDAVKYIKENINIDDMRIFNEYNFGSYLLLNDIPVFIDSRADLYTKQFSGLDYDILDDWKNIVANYQEKFTFYNITHVLISKKDNPLYYLFEKDRNFTNLYEDKYFILYERDKTANYVNIQINQN